VMKRCVLQHACALHWIHSWVAVWHIMS
jgi:hypothetical protein